MPYYCTVPRCTSMAGKAKNVSFHQFPRDEELAQLWNKILKRGKPYTKYSKVCSLHFTADDYTITSVGKNKGQWKTLRKDAIPSRNLPSESPPPAGAPRPRSSSAYTPSNLVDPQIHMAHAIYMQTVLAMHSSGATVFENKTANCGSESSLPNTSGKSLTDIEQLLKTYKEMVSTTNVVSSPNTETEEKNEVAGHHEQHEQPKSYKCEECTKCFKDPDVFLLHKRTHKRRLEKENLNINRQEETLKANPILVGLLNTEANKLEMPNGDYNVNNILSIENQILAALSFNMEAYVKTLASLMTSTDVRNNYDSQDIEENNGNINNLENNNRDLENSNESIEQLRRINEQNLSKDAELNFKGLNEEIDFEKHNNANLNGNDSINVDENDGIQNLSVNNGGREDILKCSRGEDVQMSDEESGNLVIAFDGMESEGKIVEIKN